MPINVKGAAGLSAKKVAEVRKAVPEIPTDANVTVGATKTYVALPGGATLTLPMGATTLTGEAARKALLESGLLREVTAQTTSFSEHVFTSDEEWAQSVAPSVLPEPRPLQSVTALYQRANAKGGDPYLSCFVGPNLIGVCRIRDSIFDVKFRGRYTVLPDAEVLEVLKTLGVPTAGSEYVSAHVKIERDGDRGTIIRAALGSFYAALRSHLHSDFPDLASLGLT